MRRPLRVSPVSQRLCGHHLYAPLFVRESTIVQQYVSFFMRGEQAGPGVQQTFWFARVLLFVSVLLFTASK